ncbi:MAG: THUMP domain-containing protein [Promethearchaeota archaeon]
MGKISGVSGLIGFNLLVSTQANFERDAGAELWFLTSSFFEVECTVRQFKYPGLILGRVGLEPRRLTRKLLEEEIRTQFIQKIVPVDRFVETDLKNIPLIVREFVDEKFSPGDEFRITLRKRGVKMRSGEVIEAVASNIPEEYKVNLESPAKTIYLEMFPRYTGISVLETGDVFKKSTRVPYAR